jgi:transcriptional regulator with XRE-family HTH domain
MPPARWDPTEAARWATAVRALRDRLRLTQAGLAQRVGVSKQAVTYWESGRAIPQETRQRALVALGLTFERAPAVAEGKCAPVAREAVHWMRLCSVFNDRRRMAEGALFTDGTLILRWFDSQAPERFVTLDGEGALRVLLGRQRGGRWSLVWRE